MFSVEDEQDFEGFDKLWVGLEIFLIKLVEHVQEVLNVAQFFGWEVEISANSVSVRVGGDGGNITDDFVDLFVSDFFVFVDCFSD